MIDKNFELASDRWLEEVKEDGVPLEDIIRAMYWVYSPGYPQYTYDWCVHFLSGKFKDSPSRPNITALESVFVVGDPEATHKNVRVTLATAIKERDEQA